MEEFRKLSWSWKTPSCDEGNVNRFDGIFDDKNDVFHWHLNEISKLHEQNFCQNHNRSKINVSSDPRNHHIIEKVVNHQMISNECISVFKYFPSKSLLNEDEHLLQLNILLNKKKQKQHLFSLKGIDQDDNIRKSLKEKVLKENKLYCEFVKNYFLSNNIHRKKNVNPNVMRLFVNNWKIRVNKFVENHPKLFSQSYRLATAVTLKYDKMHRKNIDFETNSIDSSKIFQPSNSKSLFTCNMIKQRSKGLLFYLKKYYDENQNFEHLFDTNTKVENLGESDIIISMSSCLCLLQGYLNTYDDWFIPINIVTENSKKVVSIDKPFPRVKLGSHQKNYNIALDIVKAISLYQTNSYIKSDIAVNKVSNRFNYKIETLEKFMREFNSKHENHSNVNALLTKNNVKISSERGSLTLTTSFQYDAIENGKLIILSPKLEYQPEFGQEQMTQYELVKEWIYLKFSKDTIVKRIRMHYSTYSILSITDICLNIVNEELTRFYGIEEAELLKTLYHVLELIKEFPDSHYLGRYDLLKKNRMLIYKEDLEETNNYETMNTNRALLNLKDIFLNITYHTTSLDELEWTPIDVEGITDMHLKNNVSPGLFPYYNNCTKEKKRKKKLNKN
uniref:CSON001455 protein n=1 Tax=Culicoides sonorensis TaxID=179676 RepID=A0A336K4Y8_CULSO